MSTGTDKALEEALQAAVARMNKNGNSAPTTPEPIALLMALLPKLLEKNEERDDLLEKIDELQKDDLATLREQVRGARKQLHRVLKTSEIILAELGQLREQQTAVGNAVLHLARQMSRVQILEEMPDDEGIDEDELSTFVTRPARRATAAEPENTRRQPRKR
jgi:hypothetical protein